MRKIIDIHAHVGDSAGLYVAGSIDAVTVRMKKTDITHSVISPIPGYEDFEGVKSTMRINQQMADIKSKNPEMFPMALAVVEPRHGKEALTEVEHAFGKLQLDGLMFHNDFNGVTLHDSRMFDIIAEARRYKNFKLVLSHTAQHSMLEPPFAQMILAEKFPDVTFVCGHPMMSLTQLDNMALVVKHCPNVYLDTCYLWSHGNQIDRAIELLGGSERFIFGTDNPYFLEDLCIDKILIERSKMTPKDRENIYSGNLERLFGQVEA